MLGMDPGTILTRPVSCKRDLQCLSMAVSHIFLHTPFVRAHDLTMSNNSTFKTHLSPSCMCLKYFRDGTGSLQINVITISTGIFLNHGLNFCKIESRTCPTKGSSLTACGTLQYPGNPRNCNLSDSVSFENPNEPVHVFKTLGTAAKISLWTPNFFSF
ncbi:uncharacterized protein LOC125369466 [Ricinus communis]|uniref:uncharacterized protein LOC125369466 n=1 Tax=Ricinus communis TaxID=3988 RepID=UPI00201AE934|nr:uncharacterized protein LOC125369466 [Ricinus communis]